MVKKQMFSKFHHWEHKFATIACSVGDTSSGQKLMATLLPTAALAYLLHSQNAAALNVVPGHYDKTHVRSTILHKPLVLPAFLNHVLEELCIWMRGVYLALLFTPMILTAPVVFLFGAGGDEGREKWMNLVLWTLQRAGPAFIKWAQWASSRPDLFPQDLCERMETLQTNAPAHPGELSKVSVDMAFSQYSKQPLFDEFDEEPVASGSIAQVHRAVISSYGSHVTGLKRGTVVAVKVRHPGVTQLMHRDFVLMQRAAWVCSNLPGLSELRLDESIRQFGGPLKEQLDLAIEAAHLTRFKHNFRLSSSVSFPTPIYPLVSSDVLVESFEEGSLITSYINTQQQITRRHLLADIGLNLYLQMLLKDNFCHADLHPGNILVKEVDTNSWRGIWRMLTSVFDFQPKLVLLDAGMIAELKPLDQKNIVDFFRALTRQDGEQIAHSILRLSEQHTCKDPEAFIDDLRDMFERLDPQTIRTQTSMVLKDMIETLRQHKVTLKSTVSTVVVTTLVLEGWSSKLNPDLHILDTMRDMLSTDWSDRIGRVVDKIMINGGVAVN